DGTEIIVNTTVTEIKKAEQFTLRTSAGNFQCASLVIASGGLSIPKIGATNFGYLVAEQFGLYIISPKPGLVPLLWNDEDRKRYGELSGISFPVKVTFGDISFRENMLFTHKGLSGPAILQLSSYWKEGKNIMVDLLEHIDIEKIFLKNSEKR